MRGHDSQQGIAPDIQSAEPPPAIGSDERRMHVRAYNYWVSLLAGRAFPSIADLDPASLDDFGPNSVLLDFTDGVDDPAIRWLGRALRDEGGLPDDLRTIADVPGRSLLSRLTDHNLQIIANRAPIGFEAEFVNVRGNNAMYRGILMPFSSDGQTIDFIYGVINWKELADAGLAADIAAAADSALRDQRAEATARAGSAAWADGPSRSFGPAPRAVPSGFPADPVDLAALGAEAEDATLADALAAARESAEEASSSELRSRGALYRAIAQAYAFACAALAQPDDYAELLDDAGLKMQARAPMTPIVKLVFGTRCDKTRLAEYAAVLSHADRLGIPADRMAALLDGFPGGLKGIVAAERLARRPVASAKPDPRERLRAAPAVATAAIDVGDEFVLLLARRGAAGEVAILGVADDSKAVARALERAARG